MGGAGQLQILAAIVVVDVLAVVALVRSRRHPWVGVRRPALTVVALLALAASTLVCTG